MLYIDKTIKTPYYRQLYQQILDEILSGKLKPGEVLTGSRVLAKEIGIGRNTVDNAYAQLAAEGYIAARRGAGFVVQHIPKIYHADEAGSAEAAEVKLPDKRTGSVIGEEIKYDLFYGHFPGSFFPAALWRRYLSETLSGSEGELVNYYHDKQGDLSLREALVSYLLDTRAVSCTADRIIITSGLQSSLDIVCRLLFESGDVLAMEEPGYDKSARVFIDRGVSLLPVPIDEHGAIAAYLPINPQVKAVYVTPSHQFPTGAVMPIQRRYELLAWAKASEAFILEDDYDSEFTYHTEPAPALQSIDSADRVIYLGTFSKSLSPSIRMGYIVLPKQLMERYHACMNKYNNTVSWLDQRIVGKLIENGHYRRQVRRLRTIFRKRHDLLIRELEEMNGFVKPLHTGAGLHFLLEFSQEKNADELIAKAAANGVRVYSPKRFWQNSSNCPENMLYIGFSLIDVEKISACMKQLNEAWFD